jgi:hypothetical protein
VDHFAAATLSESLVGVVGELLDRHFILCAIVTDNAKNEIRAVGDLAKKTRLPIVRIPCLSHTLNLAVQDSFTAAFGRGVFLDDLRVLREALETRSEGDAFHGLLSICPTRWLCFGEFVAMVARKITLARDALRPGTAGSDVLQKYDFADLKECFDILNSLLTATENRRSCLDVVWPLVLEALGRLKGLQDAGAHRPQIHRGDPRSVHPHGRSGPAYLGLPGDPAGPGLVPQSATG